MINTEDTAFGRDHAEERAAHPGKSGFHLLSNGLDAFVARAVSSHYAERSIDVQYYLYHNDLVSRLFTDLLLKAADRGVRVRLLVDDMDLAGRDLGAAALDSHPNIEVRIFNLIPNIIWHRCSNPIWKELIIISPYFVPGKSGTFFFDPAGQRGVRVRILTNSLASNAVGLVHSGYRKYRKKLLRVGVELYELNKKLTREQRKEKKGAGGSSKASLHTKSFVFDHKHVFIGSLNIDTRAMLHNTEIGVVLKVPEIAEEMSTWFEENIEQIGTEKEQKRVRTASLARLGKGGTGGLYP